MKSVWPSQRLRVLVDDFCTDHIEETELRELEALLRDDPDARAFFAAYCRMHAELFFAAEAEHAVQAVQAFANPSPAATAGVGFFENAWAGTVGYFSQIGPLSYLIATVLFGLGLLAGSWISIKSPVPLAQQSAPPVADSPPARQVANLPRPGRSANPPEKTLGQPAQRVGRITGLADCRWADRAGKVSEHDPVTLGRRYALAAGFLEITYDTGAKVILEGPVVYEVESARGGFLSLGKLTARVEKRAEGGGRRAEGEAGGGQWAVGSKSEIRNPKSELSNPQSLIPNPLFSVRTPSVTVADLGTEFGVEVERSGASKAYVFQGDVELRPADGSTAASSPIRLRASESARFEHGTAGVALRRGVCQPGEFVRHIPRQTPIKAFSTGVGLKPGDPDPHWQLVAVSNDPKFKPRPALVRVDDARYLNNDPARSQWISGAAEVVSFPNEVTYTFRATFDLAGALPDTVVLRGRFLADDHVDAIRLNGRSVAVPEHKEMRLFSNMHEFQVPRGFVPGINVLEIDVFNGGYEDERPHSRSPMALRVELEPYCRVKD